MTINSGRSIMSNIHNTVLAVGRYVDMNRDSGQNLIAVIHVFKLLISQRIEAIRILRTLVEILRIYVTCIGIEIASSVLTVSSCAARRILLFPRTSCVPD